MAALAGTCVQITKIEARTSRVSQETQGTFKRSVEDKGDCTLEVNMLSCHLEPLLTRPFPGLAIYCEHAG